MNSLPLHELWEKIMPRERRWLGWFVFAAVLLHAALFLIIRVRQPQQPAMREPVLQAMVLDVGRASISTNDLVWLEWRDPSAPILPRGALPVLAALTTDLPLLKAQASAAVPVDGLSPTFDIKTKLPSLSEQMRGMLTQYHASPSEVEIATPPQLSGTVVEIGGSLASRDILSKTEFPQPVVDRNLKVTVCLLAVSAAGLVESVLVDNSSDDAAIDQLAVNNLRNWRFAPANDGSGLQWGRATVYWHFKGKAITGEVP